MLIRTKPDAIVVAVHSKLPLVSRLQTSLTVNATRHDDHETRDTVYEFEYNGEIWTVGYEDVESIYT